MASRYDKFGGIVTLNGAIFIFAMGMFFFCSGWFFDLGKFARTKDTDWLWMALVSILLGLFGAIHGFLSIHAVARHLQAKAREAP